MKAGFVSLGCSKNLVDTEMCIGAFKKEGFEIVNEVSEAEVIVINTCGFIESAKQEAIDCILEMAEYKKNGSCKRLIVMGCLVQRYKSDLEKSIPEVDLFLSIDEYEDMWEKVSVVLSVPIRTVPTGTDRIVSTGNTTAYLKIAEGCSNRCTYCVIPSIRGPYVSREMEDILKEAEHLVKKRDKRINSYSTRYNKIWNRYIWKTKTARITKRIK